MRGLAVSDGGLTLDLARDELPRGDATTLRFTVRDEAGDAVRDFDVAHARRMHLIVVRRDGRGFQHLHPRLVDGEWRMRTDDPAGRRLPRVRGLRACRAARTRSRPM